MAIVDERGRLFGRVNLVDAVLIVVFLGLVPLAYGGYALFRTPPPRLTSVAPTTMPFESVSRVTIHGENLRPYMRVSFGDRQGRSFLFQSTSTAEVELGEMPPGTYDVVLYDYAQEWSRLPKALTVAPPSLPSTSVVVVGIVANLPESIAKQIVRGLKVTDYGEILAAGRAIPGVTRVHTGEGIVDIPVPNVYQVPIMVKIPCEVQMVGRQPACLTKGIVLAPDAFLPIDTALGRHALQINQVLGIEPIESVEAVVRLVGDAPAIALVAPGDTDLGTSMNELAAGAKVLQVAPRGGSAGEVAARDVTLRLQAQQTADGWRYAGEALRAGAPFVLRTRGYELHGSVLRLAPVAGAKSSR